MENCNFPVSDQILVQFEGILTIGHLRIVHGNGCAPNNNMSNCELLFVQDSKCNSCNFIVHAEYHLCTLYCAPINQLYFVHVYSAGQIHISIHLNKLINTLFTYII